MTDIEKKRAKLQRGVGDILLKRSIRQFSPYSPETIREIFNYLHKEDVVIKVARELPPWKLYPADAPIEEFHVWVEAQYNELKEDYTAVESLIETP